MTGIKLDTLGYSIPATAQKPHETGDKNNEREALAPSEPQPNHQETNTMNTQEQNYASPVPAVPQKETKPLAQRAKNFGSVALAATGEHIAKPFIQGVFAGAGALVTYKACKKLGWL